MSLTLKVAPPSPPPRTHAHTHPVYRTEITRFPHAVLEVKLSLQEGQQAPAWVQEMIDSGYLTEVGRQEVLAPPTK